MTANSFFDHAINIASDKHVLFLAGIVFFAISKAKDREKFLAKAELSYVGTGLHRDIAP